MTRIRLHESSPEFSRIAFGTWRLLDHPESTPDAILGKLRACLDAGITTIDTAEIYGGYRVEEVLGEALRKDPGVAGRVEIITKCGIYVPSGFHPNRRVAHYNASAERIVKSAEKSLRHLGVEALDLLLIHRPDWMAPAEDTAAGLNRLLRDGKIRSAGVSNYSATQFRTLQAFLEKPLVTNQVEFSPFCVDPVENGIFDQCQELGIRPMAWSPTGGGRLFDPADPVAARVRESLESIAPHYDGAGIDRLCFAWILTHPAGAMGITGSNRIDRILSAAKADAIRLSRQDWYAVLEAARGHRIP